MDSTSGPPRAAAVIVAAGRSTRFGGGDGSGGAGPRKPLAVLGGRTLLERSCAACAASARVGALVVVAHPADEGPVRDLLAGLEWGARVHAVVPGGEERADSVRLGVRAVPRGHELVCVHDAARPLVHPASIDLVVAAAERDGAALLAVPVRDTLKESEDGERVVRTVDRSRLWCAQTPQVFRTGRLLELLERAESEGFRPTDEAALWERYVGAVTIVPGEASNVKITTPEDLEIARALLARRGRPEAAR